MLSNSPCIIEYWLLWVVCPYKMITVVFEFECPKSADTVAMSTPAFISIKAWA